MSRPPIVKRRGRGSQGQKPKQLGSIAHKRMVIPHLAITRPISWPLCDVISFCVQNFAPANELSLFAGNSRVPQFRVCGSWVQVLPELSGGREENPLPSAIKALGVSIAARGCSGWAPIPDVLRARSQALADLQDAIRRNTVASSNELAAAVMCLFLSEVLVSPNPTTSHADAFRNYSLPPMLGP